MSGALRRSTTTALLVAAGLVVAHLLKLTNNRFEDFGAVWWTAPFSR